MNGDRFCSGSSGARGHRRNGATLFLKPVGDEWRLWVWFWLSPKPSVVEGSLDGERVLGEWRADHGSLGNPDIDCTTWLRTSWEADATAGADPVIRGVGFLRTSHWEPCGGGVEGWYADAVDLQGAFRLVRRAPHFVRSLFHAVPQGLPSLAPAFWAPLVADVPSLEDAVRDYSLSAWTQGDVRFLEGLLGSSGSRGSGVEGVEGDE